MLYQPIEQATLLLDVLNAGPCPSLSPTFSRSRMEKVIREAAALGFRHIHIADEQVEAIPDIAHWAACAANAGLAFTVTAHGGSSAAQLEAIAPLLAGVYVPIYGGEEAHDRAMASPGDYRRRIEYIATHQNLPIVATFHLSRPGLERLVTTCHEAVGAGASAFVVTPVMALKGDESAFGLDETPLVLEMVEQLKRAAPDACVRLSRGWLPVKGLLEHPCNAFACHGHNCHSKKGNRPRHLIVRPSGAVVAEDHRMAPGFTLGNLAEEGLQTILDRWPGSNHEALWKRLCQEVFLQYVMPCPFPLVPWLNALALESQALATCTAGAQ